MVKQEDLDYLLDEQVKLEKKILNTRRDLYQQAMRSKPEIFEENEKIQKVLEVGDYHTARKMAEDFARKLSFQEKHKIMKYDEFMKLIEAEANNPESTRYTFHEQFDMNLSCPYGTPIVLGGKPKNRKTSFALNVIFYDIERGIGGVFVSLEMRTFDIIKKLVQMKVYKDKRISVELDEVASKYMKLPEYSLFVKKATDLWDFVEANGYGVSRLLDAIEMHAGDDRKICVIDYLQKISPEKREDTRVFYMNASRKITEHCKRLDKTYLVLSQLNNEGGYKETGALLEDAGLAMQITATKNASVVIDVIAARFSPSGVSKDLPIDNYSGLVL